MLVEIEREVIIMYLFIDFGDFQITKEIHTRKNADGTYITDGQSFDKGMRFE